MSENVKYKLGLALSGGGAKGFAHLGVLQALIEKGITPDILSGTSAGAFAGVFYADGHEPKDVIGLFEKKVFREFAEFIIPKGGFFKNEGFKSFLKKHIKARTFEELKLPFRVLATDIEKGESKIFDSGELIPAIIASCSVPIVFKPMKIDGHYYVDGGLFKNLPVTTIRSECVRVMGVNVSPITEMTYKDSLKYVAERSFHYMSISNTVVDRYMCDYLFESQVLAKYSMFDLDHVSQIYEIGYELAQRVLEEKEEDLIRDFPHLFLTESKAQC